MHPRIKQLFILCIVSLSVCTVWSIPFTQGREMQSNYGYAIGESFTFTDSLIEIFDINQTHLREEITHTIKIQILAIDIDMDNYTLRITATIANLSAGLSAYMQSIFIEGYTPIVTGPRSYFTHTNWDAHITDFTDSANDYIAATQMSGISTYDLDIRHFYWNLTKTVDASISPYDVDQDGEMDAYDVISKYSAQFDERGVLELREYITEFRFHSGAQYIRHRHVSLVTAPSLIAPILTPVLIIFVTVIVVATGFLCTITVFWFRRSTPSPSDPPRSSS